MRREQIQTKPTHARMCSNAIITININYKNASSLHPYLHPNTHYQQCISFDSPLDCV